MFTGGINCKIIIFLALITLLLIGCAGVAPVPGGEEATNKQFYDTNKEFLETLALLQPQMSQQEVFNILKREREDFKILDRSEILNALYGRNDIDIKYDDKLLTSLYGYSFSYKMIRSAHGFSSPIRVRTNESGYSYEVSLIFEHGFLFEKPMLSGGIVNKSRSKTIFDYINPSRVFRNETP